MVHAHVDVCVHLAGLNCAGISGEHMATLTALLRLSRAGVVAGKGVCARVHVGVAAQGGGGGPQQVLSGFRRFVGLYGDQALYFS